MITDEQLFDLLEERLPKWAEHGHDKIIWKFAALMKKYYDESRVIKIKYSDVNGVVREGEINSTEFFELTIVSDDE